MTRAKTEHVALKRATRLQALEDEARIALVEAMHAYPPKRISPRRPSARIQDFVYQKTGALPTLRDIHSEMERLSVNAHRSPAKRATYTDRTDSATPTIPMVTTIPASPRADAYDDTKVSSHPPSPLASDQPSSMSRRRLALNIPALNGQMTLPMPQMTSFRLGSNSAPTSPMLSPSAFLAAFRRPKLLHRGSSSSSDANPHTPVDQLMHTPLNPPEAPRPPPRPKGQAMWNEYWQAQPDELSTPLFGGQLVKSASSSGSSGTATPTTLGSLSGTPVEPMPGINPVVHHRLNPRAPILPRRLSYGFTRLAQATRKSSDASSQGSASSPLSPMFVFPAIPSSPTLPWPNVDANAAPDGEERTLASPLVMRPDGRRSAPSTPAVLSDAPAQANVISYFNLRMPA